MLKTPYRNIDVLLSACHRPLSPYVINFHPTMPQRHKFPNCTIFMFTFDVIECYHSNMWPQCPPPLLWPPHSTQQPPVGYHWHTVSAWSVQVWSALQSTFSTWPTWAITSSRATPATRAVVSKTHSLTHRFHSHTGTEKHLIGTRYYHFCYCFPSACG